MSKEIKRTHYFKVFFADDGFLTNDDGEFTFVGDREVTMQQIGASIMGEIDKQQDPCYGYRIDYRLTPITKDPFK